MAERAHGDIVEATAFAYRSIATFLPASGYPHLLRTWNYFDAINLGSGDEERYRGFCSGRVIGLERLRQARHPAATVIARRDGERVLIKAYLRRREYLAEVEELLRAALPSDAPLLVLHGDVCRHELLLEFDCVQSAR